MNNTHSNNNLMTKDDASLLVNYFLNTNEDSIATEISEGNMNIVYRVKLVNTNQSYIVKQAPPFIRSVGEEWPLTENRIFSEYHVLTKFAQYSPRNVVEVLHFNHDKFALILEDLHEHQVLRNYFINKGCNGSICIQIGRCLGDIYSNTLINIDSSSATDHELAIDAAKEMCATTSTVFFDDPYYDCERNHFDPALKETVEALWRDLKLIRKVKDLKHQFHNKRQSLLHGDLHTGSIMISDNRIKLIDAEFGFVGPIGFDIGVLIGNLLLSHCSVVESDERLAKVRLVDIENLWHSFSERFRANLVNDHSKEEINNTLNDIWMDALGFAGTEMIRRTIGVAHVDDIDSIPSASHLYRARLLSILIGKQLILSEGIAPESLIQSIQEITLNYRTP